ncbi:DNA polymerase III subunit beta [compost metagenome]
MPADYSGEPVDVGLNSAYLRDMLSALPAGRVTISASEPMYPVRIKGENDNWDGTLMPMRVS